MNADLAKKLNCRQFNEENGVCAITKKPCLLSTCPLAHPTPLFPGMHCGWCGNKADAYPKRLDIVSTTLALDGEFEHGEIKVLFLCRQCGHFSEWMEVPKAVNF